MSLPKIEIALFKTIIPSTGVEVQMRPMTIKEEKILLMAKESNEEGDILSAIIQIVNNCIVDPPIPAETLSYFDIEWLFLKIRSNSVSNIVILTYTDTEDDDKEHEIKVDLEKIKVPKIKHDGKIELTGQLSLTLRYPPVKIYSSGPYKDADANDKFNIILRNSIDKIWNGNEVHDPKNYSEKDLMEFIDSIPSKQFDEINKFFDEQPSLYYRVEYETSSGEKKTIELTTLTDFFTF